MLTSPAIGQYEHGSRVKVTQFVRVGHLRWYTTIVGTVEAEGLRPVGGMEMGGKALYCHQPTVRLRLDDGEITVIALDANTQVETLSAATANA
jgi:hypothetical protein